MPTEATGQAIQQPQPSIEERLGALLGAPEDPTEEELASEDGQPTEDATGEPEPDTFELEVDGEKFTLPKKLEKGFMQEKDYTSKTMSLADQRRALDVHHEQLKLLSAEAEFRTSINPELQQLGMLDTLMKNAQQLDWQNMSTDELIRKRHELDGLKDQRDQLIQGLQGKQQQWSQQQTQKLNDLRAKGTEAVKKAIPSWDEAAAKAVKDYGLSQGYTEAELANIFDPRHAVTLWKAQQYDSLKSKAQPAVRDAKNIKPGSSNPMSKAVKDKLAFQHGLKKTEHGSSERKALIEDRIASKFGG